jgi:hypothetical protein
MNDASPDPAASPDPVAGPTAVACSVGAVLAAAARLADRDQDADVVEAIIAAMIRLLSGLPLRSDGKLTVKSLAAEAGLRRNKLTHKHMVLKDLFYALVRAENERPRIADDLQTANAELIEKVGNSQRNATGSANSSRSWPESSMSWKPRTTGCARRWRHSRTSQTSPRTGVEPCRGRSAHADLLAAVR